MCVSAWLLGWWWVWDRVLAPIGTRQWQGHRSLPLRAQKKHRQWGGRAQSRGVYRCVSALSALQTTRFSPPGITVFAGFSSCFGGYSVLFACLCVNWAAFRFSTLDIVDLYVFLINTVLCGYLDLFAIWNCTGHLCIFFNGIYFFPVFFPFIFLLQ